MTQKQKFIAASKNVISPCVQSIKQQFLLYFQVKTCVFLIVFITGAKDCKMS